MLLLVLALWTNLNDFKCVYLKKKKKKKMKMKWKRSNGGTSGPRYEETPTL